MKSIPGYEDYFVTLDGRVLGKSGDYLRGKISTSGYMVVTLAKNKSYKSFSIHRLIACSYLGLDLEDRDIQVNHLDGNRLNNSVNNLEICTPSENVLHTRRLMYPEDTNTHKTCRKCKLVKLRSEFTARKSNIDGLGSYCKVCHNQH